jgi:nucleoside-diphosphate-sugar epimerase
MTMENRKKTAFLTGGTGFVGFNIAQQLVANGWQVIALHRQTSSLAFLERLPVTRVIGDILEPDTLTRAMPEKVDAVFHVAADLNTWSRHNAAQTAVNVDGTNNMVEAALARQAGRFILTSSIAAYGHHSVPVSETTPSSAPHSWVNYDRSKWEAEESVRRGNRQGLFTVIINPCAIFGPWDTHSWAQMIFLIRDGKIKGIPPGSVPINHVVEVAKAHLAAAEHGSNGENYILNGEVVSFENLFRLIADQLDVELKARVMPSLLLKLMARIGTALAVFTGKPPEITPEMAALMCADTRCDTDKAEGVLGYKRVPARICVEDSIAWLQSEGLLE